MQYSFNKPSPEMKALLAKAGSGYEVEAGQALHAVAKVFEQPMREGLFAGDIVSDLFTMPDFTDGQPVEFELDPVAPGTQKEYMAFTVPAHGYIPQFTLEGDYATVPTYRISAAVDWLLRYSLNSRWDVAARAMRAFEAMITKKRNDDGFHVLITAAADRNIIVYDSDAGNGQFSKRLVSLGKTVMRRQGGGNSSTINRSRMTDIYFSPESLEDIRNWGVDILDPVTRQKVYASPDNGADVHNIFDVNLHDIDELGEGQEYQNFYINQLGGTLPGSKLEIAIGVDKGKPDTLIMPVREQLQIFEDAALHRLQKSGIYGWMEIGAACLDNRVAILLAI